MIGTAHSWVRLWSEKTNPVHLCKVIVDMVSVAATTLLLSRYHLGQVLVLVMHIRLMILLLLLLLHHNAMVRILALRAIRTILIGRKVITVIDVVLLMLLITSGVPYHSLIDTFFVTSRHRWMQVLLPSLQWHALSILRAISQILLPTSRIDNSLRVVRLLFKIAILR